MKEITTTEYLRKVVAMHSMFDWLWGFTQIFLAVFCAMILALSVVK